MAFVKYCVIQASKNMVEAMALPSLPKKEPRPIPVTVRLSKKTVEQLKTLAEAHNMSQADVIEHLISHEFNDFAGMKSGYSKKKRD